MRHDFRMEVCQGPALDHTRMHGVTTKVADLMNSGMRGNLVDIRNQVEAAIPEEGHCSIQMVEGNQAAVTICICIHSCCTQGTLSRKALDTFLGRGEEIRCQNYLN